MSYSNIFVWFCFLVSVIAFILVRRAGRSAEPSEQPTWIPLGVAPDGWGYVAQGLQASPNGALRLGPATTLVGASGITLGGEGMTFGKGYITFGTGKVRQPLRASSATAIEGEQPPVRMKIEINTEGEKFTLYAANAQEAQRFLDRAVSAQHTQTITGKLTWEGK